jgi:ribonucleoside-diphosphate reductase beta chain
MATNLLDLAEQGDPGTLASEEQAAKVQLMEPQQLYELWERQPWQSQAIDFSKDREDWAALSDEDKGHMLWNLSSFYIGEERVTTEFSGLVMAHEDEQEEAFLLTQQVDEARHMQFFDRFYREVVELDEGGITGRLDDARQHLNDAFIKLFDEDLVETGRKLIADPKSRELKVEFITAYHMVIEGTLALTGQRFITDFFEKEGILPGFVEGFNKVARDEHRHVAYGTWYLQQSAGKDDALAERMQAKLRELLPVAAGVLVPRGYEVGDEYEILGYSSVEVNEFAFNCLTRRLKAIGVPLAAEEAAVA